MFLLAKLDRVDKFMLKRINMKRKILHVFSLFVASTAFSGINYPCNNGDLEIPVREIGNGIYRYNSAIQNSWVFPGNEKIIYDVQLRVVCEGNGDDTMVMARFKTQRIETICGNINPSDTSVKYYNLYPLGHTCKMIGERMVAVPEPNPNWYYNLTLNIHLYVSDCNTQEMLYRFGKTFTIYDDN